MKRRDAFRKLRTICQRLDEVDPEQFFVIPLRLYLFGSLLTDKPNPGDIDLLFEYHRSPTEAQRGGDFQISAASAKIVSGF